MDKKQKTRDQIIWPFDPNKIPITIRLLWCISSFALSAIGFMIGVIFIDSNQLIIAVVVFVYAFFMVGVGVYQIKKSIAGKNKSSSI